MGNYYLVQMTDDLYLSLLHVGEGGSESAPCGSNVK
jgi:hypothetical protein